MSGSRNVTAGAGRVGEPPLLLMVSERPPSEWHASAVVFRRHLLRLANEGAEIAYAYRAAGADRSDGPAAWLPVPLPERRPWWPPVRRRVPGSALVRVWLLGRELAWGLHGRRPAAVLGHLSGTYYPALARSTAERYGCPLLLFAHDDWRLWSDPRDRTAVDHRMGAALGRADHVYAVSEPLAEYVARAGAEGRVTVLPPIPGDAAPSRPQPGEAPPGRQLDPERRPRLIYSGNLYPDFSPVLTAIAEGLEDVEWDLEAVVFPDRVGGHHWKALMTLAERPNVYYRPAFDSSTDAREYLRVHADALLVAHPAIAPRLEMSFPSKLADLSRLGKPILIAAPSTGALSRWAAERDWEGLADSGDPPGLRRSAAALADPDTRERMSAQSRSAAEEFDPGRIHRVVLDDLIAAGVSFAGPVREDNRSSEESRAANARDREREKVRS